jgi:hypothetical protein
MARARLFGRFRHVGSLSHCGVETGLSMSCVGPWGSVTWMLGVGGIDRGEGKGCVDSRRWCSDLRALASTSAEELCWRVWKLLRIMFGALCCPADWCAYKCCVRRSFRQRSTSVQTIYLEYRSVVSRHRRTASREFLSMSCFLRSSNVARGRNNVVLNMRQNEHKIKNDEAKSRQVRNVRHKLVETFRRHGETNHWKIRQ